MKTYTFRPYFGHDCDSEMGFNNGYYLDEISVQAPNEATAIEQVITLLRADAFSKFETNTSIGDLYLEFGHIWRKDEEELTTEPEDSDEYECSYLYQFVNLGEPEISE